MNQIRCWISFFVMCGVLLNADMVELQDGTRYEGKILAENPDSIEIEVGSNDKGTIRRVLIIDASEIRTWMADEAGRVRNQNAENVNRLGAKKYIERLIEEAQLKVIQLDYDAGILQLDEAAELAGEGVDGMEPHQKADMLELKAYAYRLQLKSLEGKLDLLEDGWEGLEDNVEAREALLRNEIASYREKKRKAEQSTNSSYTAMGSRFSQSDLQREEQQLKARQERLLQEKSSMVNRTNSLTKQKLQTEVQLEMVEEKLDRAEDLAREAQREARRQDRSR